MPSAIIGILPTLIIIIFFIFCCTSIKIQPIYKIPGLTINKLPASTPVYRARRIIVEESKGRNSIIIRKMKRKFSERGKKKMKPKMNG